MGRILWRQRRETVSLTEMFERFQPLLVDHQHAMDLITDMAEKSGGEYIFDRKYIEDTIEAMRDVFLRLAQELNLISSNKYMDLYGTLERIFLRVEADFKGRISLSEEMPLVVPLETAPLDIPELIGEKANTLAEILQRLSVDVPPGFVITSKAYHRFLDHNTLEDRIYALIESWSTGDMDEQQASRQIQYAILAGVLPPDVAREIGRFAEKARKRWAVRSSAYGEDGESSFAGIHKTCLDIPSEDLQEAYKEILASLFSPEALVYRRERGLMGEEAAMAVLCQEMIHSRAAGVIHTLDPEGTHPDCMVIYATGQQGTAIVGGRSAGERFWVSRSAPHVLKSKDGGSVEGLSEEVLERLAHWALSLERYFKEPQEIEWALDEEGRCWILQSRRLQLPSISSRRRPDVSQCFSNYKVILRDKGVVAHAGVGHGEVFVVNRLEDAQMFPEGAVLVTKYTDPALARIVPKASAIVAERGSAAGHLATIAREFRVPALFNVEEATEILRPGMEITLDANQKVIYEGKVQELIDYELLQNSSFEETPEFRMLRRVLRRIAPLTLVDPSSAEFTCEGCKTLHDVICFIHEKAVQELMDLPSLIKRFKDARIWTLKSDIPLGLRILDLGGGVDPNARGKWLTGGTDSLRAVPCPLERAVCAGGLEHRTRCSGPQRDDVQPYKGGSPRPRRQAPIRG